MLEENRIISNDSFHVFFLRCPSDRMLFFFFQVPYYLAPSVFPPLLLLPDFPFIFPHPSHFFLLHLLRRCDSHSDRGAHPAGNAKLLCQLAIILLPFMILRMTFLLPDSLLPRFSDSRSSYRMLPPPPPSCDLRRQTRQGQTRSQKALY